MSTDSKHLVILAAGTGGHVMPGLAVAKVMASRGWKISWVGTVAGMERGLVERHGIPFHALDFQGVRGRGPLGASKGGFKLSGAFFASMKLLNELKPDAVFSTGGYVAVPFGFAAHRRKLPLVMMNCDADLLMSTNTLLPFCDALACGFAGGAIFTRSSPASCALNMASFADMIPSWAPSAPIRRTSLSLICSLIIKLLIVVHLHTCK